MRRTVVRGAFASSLGLLAFGCASDPATIPITAAPPVTVDVTSEPAETPEPTATSTTTSTTLPEPTAAVTEPPTTTPVTEPPPAIPDLDAVDVTWEEVGEFDAPIDMAVDAAGSMYVVEREGRIVRVADEAEALDISDDTQTESEQGLLAAAFHPSGAFAYVSYTNNDGDTRVDEYRIADDGSFTDRREVLAIDQPFGNHNGGDIAFGPDGLLYVGMGDGGSGSDPDRRSLDVDDLLGKMLRIDPTTPSGNLGYTVPSDNPFVGTDGADEIWAIGLRNPWRFSFDQATGDLWIADVGQGEWEEVNVAYAATGGGRGASYGWSRFEGTHSFNDDQPDDGHTPPVHEYSHDNGNGSVTGGFVYRGNAIAGLGGAYVYGDYSSGTIWALHVVDGEFVDQIEIGNVDRLASFGEDSTGELYALSLDGTLHKLVAA